MPNLKMLNSTKYLYKLTFIKCSYERLPAVTPHHKNNPKSVYRRYVDNNTYSRILVQCLCCFLLIMKYPIR